MFLYILNLFQDTPVQTVHFSLTLQSYLESWDGGPLSKMFIAVEIPPPPQNFKNN